MASGTVTRALPVVARKGFHAKHVGFRAASAVFCGIIHVDGVFIARIWREFVIGTLFLLFTKIAYLQLINVACSCVALKCAFSIGGEDPLRMGWFLRTWLAKGIFRGIARYTTHAGRAVERRR